MEGGRRKREVETSPVLKKTKNFLKKPQKKRKFQKKKRFGG